MARSQYLRWLIEHRDRIREHTADDHVDDLDDRVETLEERLDDVQS